MRNSSTPVQLLCRSSCPPNRYKLLPAVLLLDYLAMFGTREKAAPIGNKLPYCVYVYIYSIRISIHKRVFPSLDIFCFLLHQIEPRMWVEKESLFSLFRQRLFVSCNFFSPSFFSAAGRVESHVACKVGKKDWSQQTGAVYIFKQQPCCTSCFSHASWPSHSARLSVQFNGQLFTPRSSMGNRVTDRLRE